MIEPYVADYEKLEKEHWWWRARRRIVGSLLENLTAQAQHRNIPSLLDLGCGAGVGLAVLRRTFHCTGVEPNPILAEKARANSKSPIYQGSLPSDLPDLGQNFDYILLLDVLEHIDDDLAALKAAACFLREKGKVIINVPAHAWLWSVHDEINEHRRRYHATELRRLARRAAFRVISLRYWGSCAVPLAYVRRRLMGTDQNYRVTVPAAPANDVLERLLVAEYTLAQGLRVPFGLSLLAVMEKKS